jgi:pimeloyl-ACP methyl ester carboxylesterase
VVLESGEDALGESGSSKPPVGLVYGSYNGILGASSPYRYAGAARMYTNLQRWMTMEKGGNFAAMEQPAALAQEIREFFRPLHGT